MWGLHRILTDCRIYADAVEVLWRFGHARRLVFQLAEVLVTREMLTGILPQSQGGIYMIAIAASAGPTLALV